MARSIEVAVAVVVSENGQVIRRYNTSLTEGDAFAAAREELSRIEANIPKVVATKRP